MSADAESMPLAQKVKVLRQIQFALGQSRHVTPRACGLTEDEFPALATEGLLELTFFLDPGEAPDLDRFHIEGILPKGMGILAQAHVSEPSPLKISVVSPRKSIWRRMFEGTRSGLWDLIKILAGAGVGWYVKKHFP